MLLCDPCFTESAMDSNCDRRFLFWCLFHDAQCERLGELFGENIECFWITDCQRDVWSPIFEGNILFQDVLTEILQSPFDHAHAREGEVAAPLGRNRRVDIEPIGDTPCR